MSERTKYREATSEFRATVTEVERIGETHVRVMASGAPELDVLDTIAIDVGSFLRRYTVSSTDGGLEFVAYRTKRGPATPYLDQLAVGAELTGLAPERPVKTPPADATRVVVAGDDTAVGVARAVTKVHTGRVAVGIVGEALAEDVVGLTNADVRIFDTTDQLLEWVGADVAGAHFVLVGEQALNQQVRQHLFGLGVDKENVATRTFWRLDREGLE
jgi:NADPH-dependent ferric siderophore reductase